MVGNAWNLLKKTASEWSEDKVPRLGAALAYYTVFSIAPLLIIAIAMAGLVFGDDAARGSVQAQLTSFLGADAAEAINGMIQNASKPASGILATIIGIVTLLFGASGVFGQLKDAMNTIWEVAPKPGRGIMGIIADRFLSFTLVLGIGFLLLVSLLISTVLDALKGYVFGDDLGILFQILNFAISFGVITLLFAMIYKILPDVEIKWRDVWIGAVVTAFLFTIGKFLISLYISKSAPDSTYGAAGSLVLILIWIYYSAQILFFGAEFTQVYANQYGSHVVASKNAVPITEEARAQQGMPRTEDLGAAAAGGQPSDRRTPRPQRKASAKTAEVVTVQRFKALEKQRYVAAVVGFIFAVAVGALKNLRGGSSHTDDSPSI
jgi:membrane protein